MDFKGELNRYLSPAIARVKGMVSRCTIKNVQDSSKVQTMDIGLLADELRNGVERYQEYGFTSVPFPGMEAFVCFIGGERGNPVIVATGDRQFRINSLEPGEVCIYTDEGDKIMLKRGRKIEIETETLTVNAKDAVINATNTEINTDLCAINAPLTKISGELQVSGGITGGGGANMTGGITNTGGSITSNGIELETHKHGGILPGDADTEGPK